MAIHQKTVVIRQSIIDGVAQHPGSIAKVTQDGFGISRQAANRHIRALVDEGVLVAQGKTSARRYELRPRAHIELKLPTSGLQEDRAWFDVKSQLVEAPPNVVNICGIAFTEMLNNVIDHSEADAAMIDILYTAATIRVLIADRGVGIFKKVQEAYGFQDERESVLELAKGKITTAPDAHTGYGIFFTSRMVDVFSISSGKLFFTHIQPDDDWIMESEREPTPGTTVIFTISLSTKRTSTEVYNRFCSGEDDEHDSMAFSKTHVPIRLAQYGDEQLVSRSQAKRVLNRFEKFSEVLLDFQGVDFIGQAFADEIFRVFANAHPEVNVRFSNANSVVRRMIGLALSNSVHRQKTLF